MSEVLSKDNQIFGFIPAKSLLSFSLKENVAMAEATIPNEFWIALISNGLIDENYFDHLTISK